jgi:hypothetical protein
VCFDDLQQPARLLADRVTAHLVAQNDAGVASTIGGPCPVDSAKIGHVGRIKDSAKLRCAMKLILVRPARHSLVDHGENVNACPA